jgi:methionyl-tRNA formyltransferase
VGVTAHLVDGGIDTGPIVRRELVPVDRGDNLLSLRAKTEYRSADLMAELTAAAARGQPLDGAPQSERHPMCTYPSAEERARIEAMVAAGAAYELWRDWRERPELRPGTTAE